MSGVGVDQLHVMVADVTKSFDTVDRSILDCTLGRLGLPGWFRKAYFACHSQVRLRLKACSWSWGALVWGRWYTQLLSAWYGVLCGPLWSVVVVILRLCLMLNRRFNADNLQCSAQRPGALFDSARFTALHFRSVGQDVSPGKCVLLSTSKSVRKAMNL